MRQLIDLKEIGPKGSAGQFLRFFKQRSIFPEAELDGLHDCLQILTKANKGAELSKSEVDWALAHIPPLLSMLREKVVAPPAS
jgi:hypothetical protein